MVKTDSIVIFVATTTQTKGEYNNEGSTKYLKLLVLQVKIVLVLELPVTVGGWCLQFSQLDFIIERFSAGSSFLQSLLSTSLVDLLPVKTPGTRQLRAAALRSLCVVRTVEIKPQSSCAAAATPGI